MAQEGRAGRRRVSDYRPLAAYLAASDAAEMVLTLREIQAIIGAPLPTPAYGTRQYWAGSTGGKHGHTHAWQELGWRARLEARHLRVRFSRDVEG